MNENEDDDQFENTSKTAEPHKDNDITKENLPYKLADSNKNNSGRNFDDKYLDGFRVQINPDLNEQMQVQFGDEPDRGQHDDKPYVP